ncbi:MAG TPA: hypothetical protein VHM67_01490 [Gemmatimonadaceae bacterium]|nr:hypothetical protein [Gemmatimonadaceae bacterium]
MLVLCVARHPFLADHLARMTNEGGLEAVAAVGIVGALAAAATCRPSVVAAEYELLAAHSIAPWESDPSLREVPVVAFSLTRDVGEATPIDASGIAGFFYLPLLGAAGVARVLRTAAHPAVAAPAVSPFTWPRVPGVVTR